MTNINFYTEMTTKFIVIVKRHGYQMDDYFGADDYGTTKNAYETAVQAGNGERYEWVALICRTRHPNTPAVNLHCRLFCDRRDKSDWKIQGLGGLINSLPSNFF